MWIIYFIVIILIFIVFPIVKASLSVMEINCIVTGKFLDKDLKLSMPVVCKDTNGYRYIEILNESSELYKSRLYVKNYWIGSPKGKRRVYFCTKNYLKINFSDKKDITDVIDKEIIIEINSIPYLRKLTDIIICIDNPNMVSLELEDNSGRTDILTLNKFNLKIRKVIISLTI